MVRLLLKYNADVAIEDRYGADAVSNRTRAHKYSKHTRTVSGIG